MRKFVHLSVLVLALSLLVATAQPVVSQERVVVEELEAEVLKAIGRTVIIRNDKGEIRKYTEIPEDVTIYVDGELAELSDLREGMTLHGVRFENVPPAEEVSLDELAEIAEASPDGAGDHAAGEGEAKYDDAEEHAGQDVPDAQGSDAPGSGAHGSDAQASDHGDVQGRAPSVGIAVVLTGMIVFLGLGFVVMRRLS